MSWSFAHRLTVWYLCWFFGLGCVLAAFYHWGLPQSFADVDDDLLLERIQVLSRLLGQGKAKYAQLGREVDSESEAFQSRRLYSRILDARGEPFIQTPGMAQVLPTEVFPATTDTKGQSLPARGPSGRVFDVMVASVTGSRADEKWVIQVACDHTQVEAVLKEHESVMATVLAFASLASLGIGYLIARKALRPLSEMVEATRRIRSSTLSQRVHLKDPVPELAALAENYNEMLDRLDKSFKQVSRFSADIAHELRTPLTNLRGEAEVALSQEQPAAQYREVLVSSLEEYAHISGIIDSLLFLTLAERSEGYLERESVNVSEELGLVAGYYEPLATENDLRIEMAAPGDLCINLNRALVRRALSNLVSNALAHTPPGGTIGLAAYRQESSIRVIISDNGIGIPAEHLPHLFERFYRIDQARRGNSGGAGLGLSIVQTVMDLHKGQVNISSVPGRGTSVSLEFPLVSKF